MITADGDSWRQPLVIVRRVKANVAKANVAKNAESALRIYQENVKDLVNRMDKLAQFSISSKLSLCKFFASCLMSSVVAAVITLKIPSPGVPAATAALP